jgi:plasmid stabilization system protein ParE
VTRLIWTQGATADLDAITDFLDGETPGIGSRLLTVVDRRTDLLVDFPGIGEFVPGLGLRKLSLPGFPYLLLYHVDDAVISIIRVYHSAQNWRPQ